MKQLFNHSLTWKFFLILVIFVFSALVTSAQVIINEVLYDPDGTDTGLEFVELLNTGMTPVTLTGYEIKLADSNYFIIPEFTLSSQNRVIIHNNLDGENTVTDLYTGALTNMSNTHGSVALFSGPHASDNIFDFVQYGQGSQQWESAAVALGIWSEDDFAVDVDEGYSLNLDPDGVDTNQSGDWSACLPSSLLVNCTAVSPTATASPAPTNTYTPPPTATMMLTPTPTPPPTFTPTGTSSSVPTFTPTPSPPPTETPTPSSTPTDMPSATPTMLPTGTPTPISVLINEVFFDPMGSDSGLEWVELFNPDAVAVDISGYDLKADDAAYYTISGIVLDPGARLVIHINASGVNSQDEVYAGPSSNMGNSSGFVALFSSTTHSAATMVDYIEYGTAGQTWESTAVSAGIWTAGAFAVGVDEGNSLNLSPDGVDTNDPGDWDQCYPTLLDVNCEAVPPTATSTSNPDTPTQTPSPTPTGTFTVPPTETPQPDNSVVINEVFFDPTGSDSGFEWLELLNRGSTSMDLSGFDLKADDASYYTISGIVLAPGARLVVHINTSGNDTANEVFTGPTSNMGNSSGFVALFSSTTHSAGTIVDYVEYGAAGQTWESTAVSAGIWTAGAFAMGVEEGNSLNLSPDGMDTNDAGNWDECYPTLLEVNCEGVPPTATPTNPAGTGTPTPQETPTPTETPQLRYGVVINEILYDPEGSDTGFEYVEFYNNSDDPVDLTAYDLKPDNGSYYTFPEFVLEAGHYVLVHVNAEGTDSSTDLYTGTSSNMGNSAGFIALFNSESHGASTIVDYVEYGEGGQTWESSAVSAGIWTAGDFAGIASEEGKSLSLCPNGMDYDRGANWYEDIQSGGSENPCNPPPASPTPTNTEGPSPTPTPSPTPRPTVEPVVQLAGFGNSNYAPETGGTVEILAWVTDPDDNTERVEVLYGGEAIFELKDDGQNGDFGIGDHIYGIQMDLPAVGSIPGDETLRLLFKIRAVDTTGFESLAWPFLTVEPSYASAGSYQASRLNHWILEQNEFIGLGSGDAGIYMAGYLNSRISTANGGMLNLVAVTTGSPKVASVELYYNGTSTGLYLQDDGLSGDFAAGDGVFGLKTSIPADSLETGEYFLQLMPKDVNGNEGLLWPYLTLKD